MLSTPELFSAIAELTPNTLLLYSVNVTVVAAIGMFTSP